VNLKQVKKEIEELGQSPVAAKIYPITSDWVPVTDVLAIIDRFEKHWKQQKTKSDDQKSLMNGILGSA